VIGLVIAAALGASGAGETPRHYVHQLQVVQRWNDRGQVIDWQLRCMVWDGNRFQLGQTTLHTPPSVRRTWPEGRLVVTWQDGFRRGRLEAGRVQIWVEILREVAP